MGASAVQLGSGSRSSRGLASHTPVEFRRPGWREVMRKWHSAMAVVLATLAAAGASRAQQSSVQLWTTSSDEAGVVAGLEEQPELSFRPNTNDSVPTIAVDESKIYQRMEGGGAAFTDGAAWLINQKLSAVQRDHVMLRLFDSRAGIGVSFLRNPIGSSDLTRGWYTYDDNPNDRADP